MFKKDTMKTLIASALIGGLCLTPLAAPNVAYAKDDNRVTLYSGYSRDIGSNTWFELEKDTVSTFDLHGIHYVSFWMTEYYSGGTALDLVPVIGMFGLDKNNWGSYHGIIKFEEDGSYHADALYYDKKQSKKRDSLNLTADWEKLLSKNRYGDPSKDVTRSATRADMDVFNPKEWHDTQGAHLVGDWYTIIHGALDRAVPYLRKNHPDLIQQNIALNKRDEAAALAQHREVAQSKDYAALMSKVNESNRLHDKFLKDYKAKTSRDARDVAHDMGNYTWDMFVNAGEQHPNIDVNDLIHNVWHLDYIGGTQYGKMGPDGRTRTKEDEFHEIVRFKPAFFVNANTSEFMWDSSLLEVSVLYHSDNETKISQPYKKEVFGAELLRNGIFAKTASIKGDDTPDVGGEKKIYFDPNEEGQYKTVNSSPMFFRWKAGRDSDDFWLMEYYLNEEPTGWGYHFTKVK